VYYIILDVENGNYVATYDTEAEALDHVREALAPAGRHLVARWGLAAKDDAGNIMAVAESDSLIERAGGAHDVAVSIRAWAFLNPATPTGLPAPHTLLSTRI
jgi:hypothetical protein